MPLFAVIGLDQPPHAMAKRDAFRDVHNEYILANHEGMVLVGPFLDGEGNQCGSLYFFDVDDEAQIRNWLAEEPYFVEGVYADISIRPFQLGLSCLPQGQWSR